MSGEQGDAYCVIGAGPAGLAAARAFDAAGLPFEMLERHRDVGGIWDLENPGTPMYESAHFISSRTQSAFDGFPMPDDYPDYPSRGQILNYIRAFADRYALRRHLRANATVERVARDAGGWCVTLAGGERRRYRGVVIASGHNWDPVIPSYPGCFDGECYHAQHYRSPGVFDGRRVLIVGGGNSACDIACDAAPRAVRTVISLRRGYRFLPKHIFGQPTDAFFRSGPHLPPWLAQPLLTVLLRVLVGDVRHYGLPKPDHRVLETHPIMNTQLLHYLAQGDVAAKPDIAELKPDSVLFTDGSEEHVDMIVFATGYEATIPYLDRASAALAGGTSGLYLNVVARELPELYVVGLFETDGAAYPVVSRQAELVARLIMARRRGTPAAARFDAAMRGAAPDLSGGVRYVRSPRHAIYVQFDEYLHRLDGLLARLTAP